MTEQFSITPKPFTVAMRGYDREQVDEQIAAMQAALAKARAAAEVHANRHQGKVGVLCLAPEAGLGIRNAELRARHQVAIDRFRDV